MREDALPVLQRLRRGLGAQGFGQAVNLFIRLAEVPLLLVFWGPERYGEWLMVAAIPAYLAMADGGFTGATQREMTMRMGAADRLGALAVFQSTWVLLLIVSTVVTAAAALAAILIPHDQWLSLNSMPGNTLPVVIFLLSAHTIVSFQGGLMYGGYSCEGRYSRGTFLLSVTYLLDFGGLALAVVSGGGPIEAALGFLGGRVLGLLVFLLDFRKVAPWLRYGWACASRGQVVKLFGPSLASMAFPLGEALNTQGMRLVVGLVLGPAAVAVFASTRTLCRSAMKPIVIVTRLIEPEIAFAFGAARHDLVRKLFTRSCQITLWAVVPACLVLWFVGAVLLHLWTRGQIAIDAPLYALLLLASAANSIWYTALMVPYATNRLERIAALYVAIYGCGVLVLANLLMPSFQSAGAGAALLVGELAMAAVVLPIAMRLSGESGYKWFRTIVRPPLFLFARKYMNT